MDVTMSKVAAPAGPCPSLGAALREDVAWLLSRASHALTCALAGVLDGLGVGVRGFAVLKTLDDTSAPTQLALAQCTGIDKTTLVAVLDGLAAKGLVQRRPDPRDRRARVVELTDEGRRMLAWAESAVRDVERTVLDTLDADDRAALQRALPRLVEATDALGIDRGSCI